MKLAIIGGGIIGLAIGLKAQELLSNCSVTLFEKELDPGVHASSRNSGVLHSGLYYGADSLKAKFSSVGNLELRKLIKSNGIPILESGKLIVTKSDQELPRLHALAERAQANGVQVSLHKASELDSFQPGARTHSEFLFSPTTAVSDPKATFKLLLENFKKQGGRVVTGVEVSLAPSDKTPEFDPSKFDFIVNAAGAGSLRIAQSDGLATDLELMPFLGLYWGSIELGKSLRVPIYPVPHPVNPFLGVHLTPNVHGYGKIGPTAIPVLGPEQYSLGNTPKATELLGTVRGALAMIRGTRHSFGRLVRSEAKYLFRSNLVRDAAHLMPSVLDLKDWKALPGGIRAQLINRRTGSMVDDFLVERKENRIHITNAVSPGWTSSLAFGEWIVKNHLA